MNLLCVNMLLCLALVLEAVLSVSVRLETTLTLFCLCPTLQSSDLASDDIQSITEWLSGEDVVSLWICGSSVLQLKLSKGGVKTFDGPRHARRLGAVWPSMVQNFAGLARLTVYLGHIEQVDNYGTAEFVHRIPQSLTSLSVNFVASPVPFLLALSRYPERFQGLRSLSIICMEEYDDTDVVFDGKALIGLKKLVLEFSPPKILGSCASLADLPPSLTDVSLSLYELTLLPGSHFPTALTRLQLRVVCINNELLAILPPGLLSLDVEDVEASLEAQDIPFELLPRSLTSLQLVSSEFNLTEEHISNLPPALTTLETYAEPLDASLVALLPRGLTTLGSQMDFALTPEYLPVLPPTITTLAITSDSLDQVLPPCLTSLSISKSSTLPRILPPWPKNLTALELSYMELCELPTFPKDLVILTFFDVSMTKESFPHLPESLKQLEDWSMNDFSDSSLFALFPRALTSISFPNRKQPLELPSASSHMLPRSLTLLELGRSSTTSSGWFSGLPSTLNSLSITLERLYDEDIHDLGRACPGLLTLKLTSWPQSEQAFHDTFSRALRHLPASLTHVSLLEPSDAGFSLEVEDLASLPTQLQECRIDCNTDIDHWSRPPLPNTLRMLCIGHERLPWSRK